MLPKIMLAFIDELATFFLEILPPKYRLNPKITRVSSFLDENCV